MATAPVDRFGPEYERPRQGRGCLFYGCLTLIILAALAMVGLYLAYQYVVGTIDQYVETYTDPAPQELPEVELPAEQREAVVNRVQAFRETVEAASDPENPRVLTDEERTLTLTAEEINALIAEDPDLRGHAYVTIEDDLLQGQVSIPLSGLPRMQGRYLNGSAVIVPAVRDGRLSVYLRDVQVKGQPLPAGLREVIEDANWAAAEPGEPREPIFGRRLEDIEVDNGKVIIKVAKEPPQPRAAGDGAQGAAEPGAPAPDTLDGDVPDADVPVDGAAAESAEAP